MMGEMRCGLDIAAMLVPRERMSVLVCGDGHSCAAERERDAELAATDRSLLLLNVSS